MISGTWDQIAAETKNLPPRPGADSIPPKIENYGQHLKGRVGHELASQKDMLNEGEKGRFHFPKLPFTMMFFYKLMYIKMYTGCTQVCICNMQQETFYITFLGPQDTDLVSLHTLTILAPLTVRG